MTAGGSDIGSLQCSTTVLCGGELMTLVLGRTLLRSIRATDNRAGTDTRLTPPYHTTHWNNEKMLIEDHEVPSINSRGRSVNNLRLKVMQIPGHPFLISLEDNVSSRSLVPIQTEYQVPSYSVPQKC